MGNRAVITWSDKEHYENSLGIYLHWNGGPASVTAFLLYCDLKGCREPDYDSYGLARLCQVIGNFLGGTLSLGIDLCKNLDCNNHDNGVYLCKGWRILGKLFEPWQNYEYDIKELLLAIDEKQPPAEQMGKEKLMKLYNKKTETWC